MEQQKSSKTIILNNGLYLGIIGVIVGLGLWSTGKYFELQWVNNLVGFLTTILFIVLGIRTFKKNNSGYLTWGEGVKIGMGIVMISAIITLIYTLVLTKIIDPSIQEKGMQIQEQTWSDQGLTLEEIKSAKEITKKFQGPFTISGVILIVAAFFGFVISAIISAIMKKKPL